MIEKIVYFYNQSNTELINSDSFNYALVTEGMVETLGGLSINRKNEIRKFKGCQIIFDKNPSGSSLPLPRELKSRLQEALA